MQFGRLFRNILAPIAFCLIAGQAASQAGPGASVEWNVGPGPEPTVFYDAPVGYDKLYRVCIKKPPQGTSLEIVMTDRTLALLNEECVDVESNKISIRMLSGTSNTTGIYFLVQ